MAVEADKQRMFYVIEKAIVAKESQQGLFSEEIFRPEEKFIDLVKMYGESLSKPAFAPNAIFFNYRVYTW